MKSKKFAISMKISILSFVFLMFCTLVSSQPGYIDYSAASQHIASLSKEYSSICSLRSLVKTNGGKDILVMTIGTGDKDNKPGVAVVGGPEGNHILGKNLALGFAESLLKESLTPEIKELLGKITFYVFPDVTPDATEFYFSEVKHEKSVNNRPTDDDKDFLFDEDPYEDLNKDGFITLIRVTDPSGKYTNFIDDHRIMVEADLSKGEKGGYLVYSEGIDNDRDGNFNEDGPGGVNFNRNFTFNYEEFGRNAGFHPMSESETKAVADFLYERFNIYTVFTFGPQDNIGEPYKYSDAGDSGRRITSIRKTDEPVNKIVSDKYHEITGAKGAPFSASAPGNFSDWAYFHYGRYSFSTPGWWFPAEKGRNKEAEFLKFAEKKELKDVFVPWTEIKHPDFPGKKVEVGGIKPFVISTPPADTLADLIEKNYRFIKAIAFMHPELEFLDTKIEAAGENVFRVTMKLHNKGIFATCAEIGKDNIWTRIMRISLEPARGQEVISGQKVMRIGRLEGGGSEEFSWLIFGKGMVKITAGALNTGTITTTLDLK
jgi:hypothetical protein